MAGKAAYDPKHALNAICPYFTMFPLEFPLRVLSRLKDAQTIADPFSGRGTTLYAARAKHRYCYGIDCSPVAVAISKAKLAAASAEGVLALAKSILENPQPYEIPRGEFWSLAYHQEVLKQICQLRAALNSNSRSGNALVLRAVMMGILHGPVTATGSYLSNQMQRTFAPKPAYAVRYWSARGMRPPKIDVYAAIERKVKGVFQSDAFEFKNVRPSDVVFGDASKASSWRKCTKKIDAVITSPPYYGMRTYVPDQWLRNWFVGGIAEVEYSEAGRIPSSSPETFAEGLSAVWDNIGDRASPNLDLFVRFGVLPSRNIDARDLLLSSFEQSRFSWKRVYTSSASSASSGRRQASQMQHNSQSENEFDLHLRLH